MAGQRKTGHTRTRPSVFQNELAAERSTYGRHKAVPAMNSMTIESRHRVRRRRTTRQGTPIRPPH